MPRLLFGLVGECDQTIRPVDFDKVYRPEWSRLAVRFATPGDWHEDMLIPRLCFWPAYHKQVASGEQAACYCRTSDVIQFCIASYLCRIDGGRLDPSCRRMKAVEHAASSGLLAATRLIQSSIRVGQRSQHLLVWRQTMQQASCLRFVQGRTAASVSVLSWSSALPKGKVSIRRCPTVRGESCGSHVL